MSTYENNKQFQMFSINFSIEYKLINKVISLYIKKSDQKDFELHICNFETIFMNISKLIELRRSNNIPFDFSGQFLAKKLDQNYEFLKDNDIYYFDDNIVIYLIEKSYLFIEEHTNLACYEANLKIIDLEKNGNNSSHIFHLEEDYSKKNIENDYENSNNKFSNYILNQSVNQVANQDVSNLLSEFANFNLQNNQENMEYIDTDKVKKEIIPARIYGFRIFKYIDHNTQDVSFQIDRVY